MKLKDTVGIIGAIVACGAVGGLQRETITLFQGTLGMITGIILIAVFLNDRI